MEILIPFIDKKIAHLSKFIVSLKVLLFPPIILYCIFSRYNYNLVFSDIHYFARIFSYSLGDRNRLMIWFLLQSHALLFNLPPELFSLFLNSILVERVQDLSVLNFHFLCITSFHNGTSRGTELSLPLYEGKICNHISQIVY